MIAASRARGVRKVAAKIIWEQTHFQFAVEGQVKISSTAKSGIGIYLTTAARAT